MELVFPGNLRGGVWEGKRARKQMSGYPIKIESMAGCENGTVTHKLTSSWTLRMESKKYLESHHPGPFYETLSQTIHSALWPH